MRTSFRPEDLYANERGAALVSVLLLLWLGLATFWGTTLVARATERRVAAQSRLDICAVRLSERRQKLLRDLTRLNKAQRLTVLAIYAARGAMLAGPATAAFGGLGQVQLLQLNKATALAQDTRILAAEAAELAASLCASTPFARGPVFCSATPRPKRAFQRERTLFADVLGPLQSLSKQRLTQVSCRQGNLETRLALHGDPSLMTDSFKDRYEK